MKHWLRHSLLAALVLGFFFLDMAWGSVAISLGDLVSALLGSSSEGTTDYIVLQYRLPKALTAVLTGACLSVCGLLMQTLFRNPLAGPYVLGLSSGSGLMVALVVMGGYLLPSALVPWVQSTWGLSLASFLGSVLVLLLIVLLNRRYQDSTVMLLSGMMFSSFAGAIISVLSYYAPAELLQRYSLWSMGSLTGLSWAELRIFFILSSLGILSCAFLLKPLNALFLGQQYAQSLGVNYPRLRWTIVLITALLSGTVTSLVGPVAFVGLAVPHMVRLWYGSVLHDSLLLGCILMGGGLMLLCDFLSSGTGVLLPVNAVTSLIGAPVVLYLILKKKSL